MSDRKVDLLHVTDPAWLVHPAVVDFFPRAFEDERHGDGHAVRQWLVRELPCDELGVFLAVEGGELVGLAIIVDFAGPLVIGTQIGHLYARHHGEARVALVDAMRQWCHARGIERVYALNQSPLRDDVYIERFRHAAEGHVRCSMVEFHVRPPEGS